MNLAWRGERGLGDYVALTYDRTRGFAEQIAAPAGLRGPVRAGEQHPLLPLRARRRPQVAIRERLIAEGDFHLSSTVVSGERYLRIVVTAPATDEAAIERMLDAIERADAGAGLEGSWPRSRRPGRGRGPPRSSPTRVKPSRA